MVLKSLGINGASSKAVPSPLATHRVVARSIPPGLLPTAVGKEQTRKLHVASQMRYGAASPTVLYETHGLTPPVRAHSRSTEHPLTIRDWRTTKHRRLILLLSLTTTSPATQTTTSPLQFTFTKSPTTTSTTNSASPMKITTTTALTKPQLTTDHPHGLRLK